MSSYNNNRNGGDQAQLQQQGPQQPYRFSAEEMHAIRECNRESFYLRCLPFAATGMVIVHFAVRQGFLKPHPRWGSTLKMMAAGFVGWIAGKISYQSKCEEKIMNLPNSKLGEMLRKRRGYREELGSHDLAGSETFPGFGGIDSSEDRSDLRGLPSTIMLDEYRDQPKGLDDSQRPSLDNTFELPEEEELKKIPRASTTYEELRRKNHEEYDARMRAAKQSYQSPPPSYGGGLSGRPPPPPSSSSSYGSSSGSGIPAQSTGTSKNPYGDVWDT